MRVNRLSVLTWALCVVLQTRGGEALFETPVKSANIDAEVAASWVGGTETPLPGATLKDARRMLISEQPVTDHAGTTFGASLSPGPRHLRIGFKQALSVGTLLIRGGVQVSVLKAAANYPGDLSDEKQWIPAQRIKGGQVSRDEAGRDNVVLWTLPQAVSTRALRFTHIADVTEKECAGWFGGAWVLSGRFANVAPQSQAGASAGDDRAPRLIDEHTNPVWEQWANIALKDGVRANAISPENPEWVMLSWSKPLTLSGCVTGFAGFGEAEVQVFAGPEAMHPREAPEGAWKTLKNFSGLKNRYPSTLPLDWLNFGTNVTTRALRVRMIRSIAENGHPHTHGHTKDGQRVWLGELFALAPLDQAPLQSAILPPAPAQAHPPIVVEFTLPEAGWVTLVIEDAAGKRIRNLVSSTLFERGENTAWWDGSDDLGRDPGAAKHGLYLIPTQLVAPGEYRVRGLWRKKVDLEYEFGIYSAGSVPWETADRAGGWLSNHTPPSSVLYVPDYPDAQHKECVLIGSYVSEGTAGLAFVDLDGKKFKGINWLGGNWTGAPYLCRNLKSAHAETYAFAASAWTSEAKNNTKNPMGEVRLTALSASGEKLAVKYAFTPVAKADGAVRWEEQIGGVAAFGDRIVFALTALNKLIWIDAADGKELHEQAADAPRGLAFDSSGKLFALCDQTLVTFAPGAKDAWPKGEKSPQKFDHPVGIALDSNDHFVISLRGESHQVWCGAKALGHSGAPKAGPYDALHMNNPRGVTVDSHGRVWVAEEDYQPKRVSVWNDDGTLAQAFNGPAEYGGGGTLDPRDKHRFLYNGMAFKLDWEQGTEQLTSVFYRPDKNALQLPARSGVPQNALYAGGRNYFTNAFNSNPTGGAGHAFVFIERGGIAVPCAGAGRANEWELLKESAFAARWPQGSDPKANPYTDKAAFFIWSDTNGDGLVQPEEILMTRATSGGITVQRDLSIVVARLNGKALRFQAKITEGSGIPVYDLAHGQVLAENVNTPPSSGGDQALLGADGWSIHTNAPKPFPADALGGAKNGVPQWSYPSLWPGLHASHEAPVPDRPGEIIGHTRLLGDFVTPRGGEPLWMINANDGPIHVFTADGLYVAQLFQDMRTGRHWAMPRARRGMLLNELTPSDENFWPNVEQTPEGEILLSAGGKSCLVRVAGLDSIQRIAPFALHVGAEELNQAREFFAQAEAARQAARGRSVLVATLRKKAPMVDGMLEDWKGALWVDIDKRGSAAYFNSNSKPYDVTGTVAIADGKLFAAWRTGDKDLLKNAGDAPNALFKTGGALDLMLATNSAADPKRAAPVEGDLRLLVSLVNGKPRALLYRPVSPGAQEPVPFSSPWRTIHFDKVEDVSAEVQFAGADGNFEVSIPLAVLNFKPEPGMVVRGDMGILRGNGAQTTQRAYWSNKATAIVADVPSEAELRPNLWGRWEIRKE